MRFRAASVAVVLAVVSLLRPVPGVARGQVPPALPERDAFMAQVRAAIRVDPDLQQLYTYAERRREVKVSPLGRVAVGPLRTFEVFPSADPGRTYKRLVAVEGQPLAPAELARRDAEHARDLDDQARREQRESSDQRARRLQKDVEERRDRQAILTDALAVFDAAVTGRETIDGEPVIAVTLTPKAAVRVSTKQGNWMKQFSGRAWFVERDGQFAGLDMRALDDVSIGWGIIGRLHKGSRLRVERRPLAGTWLPARLTFTGTGKTLMFRSFTLDVATEYFDYKRKER